jgi:putative heme-binding domain-containing protein
MFGLPSLKAWFENSAHVLVACILLATLDATAADTSSDSAESGRTAINLEALSRLKGMDLEANPAFKAVVIKILDQVRGTPRFVEIVRDFNIKGQDAPLLKIAAKDPAGPTGAEAMRLVLRSEDAADLKSALNGTNAVELTEALGNTGEKEIVPLLIPTVADNTKPLALRKRAVQALAKVQEGAAALLELASAQKLSDDLHLVAATELNNVRWEKLKAQAAQLLPVPKSLNAQPIPAISELVKRKGDPSKGGEVFRRESVGCLKCHQVNGEGIDFGPNLSEIGTKLAKDAIYESILDPSAGIAFGYEAWHLELKNGDDALGLIVSETADEIALKSVGGLVTRYKKTEVTSRTKQKLSIMPAGLEQTMSVDDLVNLVEYLSSLKKAAR